MDVLVTGFGARGQGVLDVASAIAEVLRADVRRLRPAAHSEQDVTVAEVLAELAAPSTVLGVLPWRRGRGALCWQVVERAAKPIVVVPPSVPSGHRPIRRVLVPLDGTAESATAVARTAALLAGAGVELLVLHVFVQPRCPGTGTSRPMSSGSGKRSSLPAIAPSRGCGWRCVGACPTRKS